MRRGRGSLLKIGEREELKKKLAKKKLPWQRGGTRYEKIVAFLEFLPITKGPLAGKKMKLLSGQKSFIRELYGRHKPDGSRLYRLGVKSEPKGNGKTGLVAGLCLCHLVGPEAEPRAEVYSAAIDRFQASIIFGEMEAILRATPELAMLVNVSRQFKKVEVIDGPFAGSFYEALSADARRAHGLSPSLFAYDELAQARDRTLLDNLINGLGKRNDALGIVISTQAPDDQHVLSQLIDAGMNGTDPSTFVQLLSAPEDADIYDEDTWRACNPALGQYLSMDEMREAANRARQVPAFEPSFRNLRLNQRVDSRVEARIVPLTIWQQGRSEVDRAELGGRRCWAALDLSGKHDLTSLTLAFPDDEEADDPIFDILPFFWTPEGQLKGRQPRERELFATWIAGGHLIPVPGPTIRFSWVAQQLVELSKEFDIAVLGYDRWRIDDFRQDLADADANFPVPLEAFGQGFKEMGPAVEWLSELLMTESIRHGGHPVLTACMAGAVTVSDPAGNLKIDKEKSSRGPVRVDGAVTLAMALELFRRVEPERKPNVGEFLSNAVVA